MFDARILFNRLAGADDGIFFNEVDSFLFHILFDSIVVLFDVIDDAFFKAPFKKAQLTARGGKNL